MGGFGKRRRNSLRRRPAQAFLTSTMLELVVVSIAMIVAIWGIANEVSFLATTSNFLEARIVSRAVAGAVTAVSSAPQNGIYCVTLPGLFSYDIAIGTETEEGTKVGPTLREVPDLGTYCPVSELGNEAFELYSEGPYKELFDAASENYGVPLPYLLAIAYLESGINHYAPDYATSGLLSGESLGSGYCGIMAVPCIDENREPEANINAGARELKTKLDYFGGDFQAALGAYSGGTFGMTGGVDIYDFDGDGDLTEWMTGFIDALGGPESWVSNLQDAEFLELPIFTATNEGPVLSAMTFGDGSRYTVEKQNACEVARGTAFARFFESRGLGSARYGFVAVLRTDDRTGAVFYLPVSNIEPAVFHIPRGGKYTLVLKKSLTSLPQGGYKERISFALRRGGLTEAGCSAKTPSICAF
ncbi:MAG: transglycosylase SLT domain-containing protein [archaeon]